MDIKTMVLFLAIIYLIQVIVLALQYKVNKQYQGVGWWLLWSLSESLGFFFLSLRDLNHPLLILLQNVFLFYGTVFTYMGVRKFLGMKLNRSVLWTTFIVFTLLLICFITVYDSMPARGALVTFSAGIAGGLTARSLFTERPASIRFTANVTAVTFTLHSLFMISSGILKLTGLASSNPMENTTINYITVFDGMLLSLLITFSLIIMLNHRMNASLAETVNDLREAEARDREHVAELEKSNNEKDTFYSVLAHDLRSPFNSLLGLTHVLAKDFSTLAPPDIKRINTSVNNSARKLYNLVESLLEWSRTQRGVMTFEPETVNLGRQIESVLQPLGGMMDEKFISMSQEVTDGLVVYADKHMLETILRNLIMNSIKFTEKGGKVAVSARPAGGEMILVTVSDTGIGMDPGLASRIFNLDSQNTRLGTSGETGTGLGLIICKEFVKKQGGRIWLQSIEGRGSTFYFTLPVGR